MTGATTGRPAAVIHDVRYSRFAGDMRPRVYAVLALARSSATRALGLRRSTGAKVWPFLLVAGAYLPALVAVGVPGLFGGVEDPLEILHYWDLLGIISLIMVAYGATTVPSLLTRERQDRVLSLYFATALSPAEYVVGKVLAALAVLLLVVLGPLLVLFVGSILVASSPWEWAQDHVADLPGLVAASLLFALFHAAIGLGIGSLTARRVFAVGGYLGVVMVTPVLGSILYFVTGEQRGWLLLDLLTLPSALAVDVLGAPAASVDQQPLPPTGPAWAVWAVVVLVGLGTVVARYRSGREA